MNAENHDQSADIAPTTHVVREPGDLWHREAPTFGWEAPKRACDQRVLHPCEAANLTGTQLAGEFVCPRCFPPGQDQGGAS